VNILSVKNKSPIGHESLETQPPSGPLTYPSSQTHLGKHISIHATLSRSGLSQDASQPSAGPQSFHTSLPPQCPTGGHSSRRTQAPSLFLTNPANYGKENFESG
jgi:hypothetical protein